MDILIEDSKGECAKIIESNPKSKHSKMAYGTK